jgi:hypothetical protein
MKIVGEGALRDRIDESLKFVLSLGCVDTMTVGFEKTNDECQMANGPFRIGGACATSVTSATTKACNPGRTSRREWQCNEYTI